MGGGLDNAEHVLRQRLELFVLRRGHSRFLRYRAHETMSVQHFARNTTFTLRTRDKRVETSRLQIPRQGAPTAPTPFLLGVCV
jgi:hypothetical protein